ncbi:MAG: MotA/TolQ/ExbB proton channel family protein [Pseudomonadota bacterium]
MDQSSGGPLQNLQIFLVQGGPAIWAIAALSVFSLALILWKVWQLWRLGAWSKLRAHRAVQEWTDNEIRQAAQTIMAGRDIRSRIVRSAMSARLDRNVSDEAAREEVEVFAAASLQEARSGLRAMELIAAIAPLLGLLGTVLGMISAFQALQAEGGRADPATLAGGIWEALLTTAAGMAVAIPVSVALTWFESVVDRVQSDVEGLATKVFTRGTVRRAPEPERQAAE